MNIVSKVTGDSLTATEFNQIPDELENVIISGGISPSDLDVQQVIKAVAQYCADGDFYEATGTADAIILSAVSPRIAPVSLTNGFKARFKASYDNTGSCTVNIANLGSKSIYYEGSPLQAGEIKAGEFYEIEYDNTNSYFVLTKKPKVNVRYFNTLSTLSSDTTIKSGDLCVTSGYYTQNDGGAGIYLIRPQDVSDVDNGGSIIIIQNSLVAELLKTGEYINVKQFGVKGDGTTDDTTAIQNVVDFGGDLYFPLGVYKVTGTIILNYAKTSITCAKGSYFDVTAITDGSAVFNIYSDAVNETIGLKTNSKISGVVLKGNFNPSTNCIGFLLGSSNYGTFRGDQWVFEKCCCFGTATALKFDAHTWKICFRDCLFQYVDDYYVYFDHPNDSGVTNVFDNCGFYGGYGSASRTFYLRYGEWIFSACELVPNACYLDIGSSATVTINNQTNIEWNGVSPNVRFAKCQGNSQLIIDGCCIHVSGLNNLKRSPFEINGQSKFVLANCFIVLQDGIYPDISGNGDGVCHFVVGDSPRVQAYGNQLPHVLADLSYFGYNFSSKANLLTNGDFEKGTMDGWTGITTLNPQIDNVNQRNGQYCMHIYHTYGVMIQNVPLSDKQGSILCYSMNVKTVVSTGTKADLYISFYGNDNKLIESVSGIISVTDTNGEWKWFGRICNIPAGTQYARVQFQNAWSADYSSCDFYIDDITVCVM